MNDILSIKKVLVVLSPDLVKPGMPGDSGLLKRAVSLARRTGCELELFHIVFDGVFEDALYASEDELERSRRQLADRAATHLAELATRLGQEGLDVRHDVRWDSPRPDAILRKIADSQPDVVMKQAREHSFVLGISTNTDWELARRSPALLWLVEDNVEDINRIVAAVGSRSNMYDDIATSRDFGLLRTACAVADSFDAEIYPVNTWQSPVLPEYTSGMAGTGAIPAEVHEDLRDQTRKKHAGVVHALAKCFGIPRKNIRIVEGRPDSGIPECAETVAADLVVLAARSIGRVERVLSPVTVEPVMARTDCDILVVREDDMSRVPESETRPFHGVPKIDLEQAITTPEDVFDRPRQVVDLSELSIDLRERILQAWEHDIRADMADENEGGPVRDIDVNTLDRILTAKSLLEKKRDENGGDRQQTLQQKSA